MKFVYSKKYLPPSPPTTPTHTAVYATDRSKAVVPVLFLFCVALWFILRDASCLKALIVSVPDHCLSFYFALLFVLVFLYSFVITSLGEEGAGPCASRAFVCLFCTS